MGFYRMALAKGDPNQLEHSQNVFVRLWNLPHVIITVKVIGRTYTSAKAANMLLSSVCEACEQGVRSAGSLAACTMQPAILILQPQFIAANFLACQVLDHLEEKMLALQYPPAKLAAGMAALMSSVIQSPAVQYILYSKLSRLAEEGTDSALTFSEHLVNYILPATSEEIEEEEAYREQKANSGAAGPKPGIARLGVLVATVCRRAYGQTAAQLQRTRSQGHQLVKSIPSVTPLVDLAKDSTAVLLEAVATARQKVLDSIFPALISGRSPKPTEEILYSEGEGPKAEDTKNPSDCSPPLMSNGTDERASHSHAPAGGSLKDPTELQPSEEVRLHHTEQILEENHPVRPLES
ncbi:perilipin-1 isoform X1 [Electrophorus electricus]|uniref:perilipin-1 isoform X1 n=2 Tax=Electrophorus electricus TaxID=8005 RepID=UPI0015CFE440|nr:perilipin-1 isoform X1 [Electrophorus electricus]